MKGCKFTLFLRGFQEVLVQVYVLPVAMLHRCILKRVHADEGCFFLKPLKSDSSLVFL